LAILSEIELDVALPKNTSKSFLNKFKKWGRKYFSPDLLRVIKPLAVQIFPSSESTTRVLIKNDPEPEVVNNTNGPISIMTVNLWHDWPRQRLMPQRLACLVDLVRDEQIDILLIQELSRTKKLIVDEWLNDKLGMAYVFSRANGSSTSFGFEEGLAVFSRFPLRNPRVAQLSEQNNPFVRRIALGVAISAPQGELLAFNVHLGLNGRQNETQIARLLDWVEHESAGRAAVIGGDFNAREDTRQIKGAQKYWQDSFRYKNPAGDGITHQIKWPWGGNIIQSRLDYLFIKSGELPWTILEADHIDVPGCNISDHKPVLTRLLVDNQLERI
jgi:endonuclease/exonuclease/phosphatase family metal-dependent hydrolase